MSEGRLTVQDIAEALAREELAANRTKWSENDPMELWAVALHKEELAAELLEAGATIGKDGRVIRPRPSVAPFTPG